ncbi:hypothetical protein OH686_01355 [Pseudomonas sp. SO81]|nr:hypothetical protein OH686_01355 [Pseudomonas sp. SO81]
MTNEELRKSWAVTLRHLAASRFFLLEHLPSQEAEDCWAQAQGFLHHNELGLGLEELQELGELCSAPKEFWLELLLAAENMGLEAHSESLRQRL